MRGHGPPKLLSRQPEMYEHTGFYKAWEQSLQIGETAFFFRSSNIPEPERFF
jgi:hypothetical protein